MNNETIELHKSLLNDLLYNLKIIDLPTTSDYSKAVKEEAIDNYAAGMTSLIKLVVSQSKFTFDENN